MSDLKHLNRSLLRHVGVCAVLSFGLGVGLVSWAMGSTLVGAVVAVGSFVVESHVKAVQHPTGGVVGELLVREGQNVRAGDVVIRLDGTEARTNNAIVTNRLNELRAQLARLEAERDDLGILVFPEDLERLAQSDQETAKALRSERILFHFRRDLRTSKKEQLKERISQYDYEIEGYQAQISAFEQALKVLDDELASLRPLYSRKLVSVQRLSALEREAATFAGDRGEAIAAAAQAAGRIAEARLQILQIDQDFKAEVGRELRSAQMETGELRERKLATEDELRRIDIRAPQDGAVHQLEIHTVGGVAPPGENLMLIVPRNDSLSLDVRVKPEDVDQLHLGQTALVRLSAFNQRTTPELDGTVERIAADLSEDPVTGLSFYLVRIHISDSERKRLAGLVLVPGMPAEAFIQTRQRTALSYLLKPLTDQFELALRED